MEFLNTFNQQFRVISKTLSGRKCFHAQYRLRPFRYGTANNTLNHVWGLFQFFKWHILQNWRRLRDLLFTVTSLRGHSLVCMYYANICDLLWCPICKKRWLGVFLPILSDCSCTAFNGWCALLSKMSNLVIYDFRDILAGKSGQYQ